MSLLVGDDPKFVEFLKQYRDNLINQKEKDEFDKWEYNKQWRLFVKTNNDKIKADKEEKKKQEQALINKEKKRLFFNKFKTN